MTTVASKFLKVINSFFNFASKATATKATGAISALLYNEDPKLFTLGRYPNRNIKKHSYEQNTRRLLDNKIIDFYQYVTSVLRVAEISCKPIFV